MSDVFISYKRENLAAVGRLVEALRAEGIGVWWDQDIAPNAAWEATIEAALTAAKLVIVAWSPAAVASENVKAEARWARQQGRLLQVFVEACEPPLFFGERQGVDLKHWSGSAGDPGFRSVLDAVRGGQVQPPSSFEAAPPPVVAAQRNNLPRRQGALIGRDAEMAGLAALLAKSDLVTITGTGGVGKTRIAIEVGHTQVDDYEDGVWLAELAPVSDPEQVPGAVARAVGIDLQAGQDPLASLVDRLRLRRCLILLDNCEHVIDAVAALAERVLDTSAGVKLLASSQELLGLDGEQVFRLRSLGELDAVALFAERAGAADQSFRITPQNAAAAAAICQRLDGIPLAIEMAAARAPSLGCDGVLQRLDDRFRVLTGGRRTALPRQRTLLATLDWSHGLLSPGDAAVFRRLGIFTGGFSLAAASDVCADERIEAFEVVDSVSSLVAKSLVAAEVTDERTRYRLLETTRAYALEKLDAAGETAATQRRHAEYFLKLVAPSAAEYYGRVSDDQLAARYHPDIDNIDRALDWAFGPAGDVQLGIAITAASSVAWVTRSLYPEYLRWLDIAAARLTPATPEVVRMPFLAARATAYMMNDPRRALQLVDEAIEAARAVGDPRFLGEVLNAKTGALLLTGDMAAAHPVSEDSLALLASLPASRLTAQTRQLAALMIWAQQGEAAARPLHDAIVAELRSFGADGLANWFTVMGTTSSIPRDDPDGAIQGLRALLDRIRPGEMFSALSTANAAVSLMTVLLKRGGPGDLEEAVRVARTFQKSAAGSTVHRYFFAVAQIAVGLGRPRDAAKLAGFGDGLRAAIGVETFFLSAEASEETWAMIVAALPEGEAEALRAEGARMGRDEAYRLAEFEG